MSRKKEFFTQLFNEMIPFNQYVGMQLLDIEDGFAKALIPFRNELVGDPRTLAIHGGVIATALDAIGGFAGMTTLSSMEDKISTIDMRIDYLRSARNCNVIVEGRISRNGNRIITTNMKAYREDDGTLLAEGKAVYNVVRHQDKDKN